MTQASELPGFNWRHLVLAIAVLGSLALALSLLPPLAQSPGYHEFADRRSFFGIPNFWDVASNVPFLLVGIAGVRFCLRSDPRGGKPGWLAFFAGVALVSIGSGYYHWDPKNATLVWDRLPMTLAFMGLFVALLGEYVHARLARVLFLPMLLLGVCSVLYWQWTGDLRLYLWVQLVSLLSVPVVMILFRARNSHSWLLPVALGWYVLAKAAEVRDAQVFALTGGLLSGHSLKHVLAAIACLSILAMLRARKPASAHGLP
ncbi:MAG: ceramidase domain-containing protein [Burkholderiales bacterium]